MSWVFIFFQHPSQSMTAYRGRWCLYQTNFAQLTLVWSLVIAPKALLIENFSSVSQTLYHTPEDIWMFGQALLKRLTWLSHPLPKGIFHWVFSRTSETFTFYVSFLCSSRQFAARGPQGYQGSNKKEVDMSFPMDFLINWVYWSFIQSVLFHIQESNCLGWTSRLIYHFKDWMHPFYLKASLLLTNIPYIFF